MQSRDISNLLTGSNSTDGKIDSVLILQSATFIFPTLGATESSAIAMVLLVSYVLILISWAKKSDEKKKKLESAYEELKLDVNQDLISYKSYKQLEDWISTHKELKEIADELDSDEAIVCRSIFKDGDQWRKAKNTNWVNREIERKSPFFRSIEKEMTKQQKEIVVRNDNRVLAVAGAGCGKTMTVVGRVKYLIETNWCKPEEILVLSFSRATVKELESKLGEAGCHRVMTRTFHKLGLDIISKVCGRKPSVCDNPDFAISQIWEEVLGDEIVFEEIIRDYFSSYFYPIESDEQFETEEAWKKHLGEREPKSIKGEKVKSRQELKIANWLYFNGIEYEYESPYKAESTATQNRRQYQPDFYLPEYDLYIEHWGVNAEMKPAPFVNAAEYHKRMKWARGLHRKNQTKLVETFSYEESKGTLLQKLESRLAINGVSKKPLSREQIEKDGHVREKSKELVKLITRALSLFKGGGVDLIELRHRSGVRDKSPGKAGSINHPRFVAFLKVFEECYRRYEKYLNDRSQKDFDDLILDAANFVEAREFDSQYRMIIVDEWQDTSQGRFRLVEALLNQGLDTRFLGVGDDWQSIYRFAGSDVTLMSQYESDFPGVCRIDLDRTFRLSASLSDASGRFITQNPMQLKKSISSGKQSTSPAVRIYESTESSIREDAETGFDCPSSVEGLLEVIRNKNPSSSILVLGRYQHSAPALGRFRDDNKVMNMTIHKSKGLEADFVIVNQVNSGRWGFPSGVEDDPVLWNFLTEEDNYPYAEERRLFYVAMTRARRGVFIFHDSNASTFVEELKTYPDNLVKAAKPLRCPKCGGKLVVRKRRDDGNKFLGCTSFPECKGSRPFEAN